MGGEVNRTTIIVIIVLAVAILGGVGFMWMNSSRPNPPANYQPVMPPGGYQGAASGASAERGGYPSGQPGGYPSGRPGGYPAEQPPGPGGSPAGQPPGPGGSPNTGGR